jgi:hypothetical protein
MPSQTALSLQRAKHLREGVDTRGCGPLISKRDRPKGSADPVSRYVFLNAASQGHGRQVRRTPSPHATSPAPLRRHLPQRTQGKDTRCGRAGMLVNVGLQRGGEALHDRGQPLPPPVLAATRNRFR